MIKKILLGIFFLLIVAQVAFAAGDKLNITDIDVEVDGKSSNNLKDGKTISKEAKPESEIEFKIKVKNSYNGTGTGDLDIEDIQVTVTIEGIDDDDDLEEDAKEFDVNADDDKTVTVKFKLPLEVDEGTYDVLIEAEGEDEDGLTHSTEARIDLEVEKEDHEVIFHRKSLSPSEISCQRTTQLSVGVINTGAQEEEETVLEIANADLGVNLRETFDLSDDPFDSDSKFIKTYSVRVADDVAPGIYPIVASVTFDDGDETETTTLDLAVGSCAAAQETSEEEAAEEEPEVVVVSPPTQIIPTTGVTVTEPTQAAEQKSLLQSGNFVTALIVGEVLVVIVAILLVVALMRRRG